MLLIFLVNTQVFFSLKEEIIIDITNAFQKIFNEFNRKPSKISVDKGSEFYNISIKS